MCVEAVLWPTLVCPFFAEVVELCIFEDQFFALVDGRSAGVQGTGRYVGESDGGVSDGVDGRE